VHSSTSTSEDRLPDGPWIRTWLLALLLAGGTLGGYEAFWRARGFVPSVHDDARLWSLARSRLHDNDPQQIVLIGASRSQLGIDTRTLAEELGESEPIQLSVQGSSCLPVLRHLSEEESFQGIVVCDVNPWSFYRGMNTEQGVQAEYVHQFHERTGLWWAEAELLAWVQSRLVLRLPVLAPANLWAGLWKGQGPVPDFQTVLPDRCIQADYSRADPDLPQRLRRQRERAVILPPSPDRWARDLDMLRDMVQRIQDRGGQVVFVVMPTSGDVRDFEERHWPRRRFWDVLAARVPAETIHFADYPSLSRFRCAEGSHLDYRDAAPFTRELAVILKTKLQGR
jgi:hypothetical protein